jgi:hypothetical protein
MIPRLEGFILRSVDLNRAPHPGRCPPPAGCLYLHWHADPDARGPDIILVDIVDGDRADSPTVLHTVRVYPESVLSGLRRYLGKDD